MKRISFNLKGKEVLLIADVCCYFSDFKSHRHQINKEKIYYIDTTNYGCVRIVACICDTCLEYYSTVYKIELAGNEDRIEIEKHIMENDFRNNLDGLCCKIGLEDLQAILNKVYNERCIKEIIE